MSKPKEPTFKPKDPKLYEKVIESLNNPKAGAAVGEFETLRQISMWTGEIFPAQSETLKMNALLLCNSPVTITLDTDNKKITFISEGKADEDKLKEVVLTTLGPGWSVQNDTGTVVKSRKPSKSKGARGRKKTK